MNVFSKKGNANVRKSTSTTSDIIGKITESNGLKFVSTTSYINGFKWHKCELSNGSYGYVREDVAEVRELWKYKDKIFKGYTFPDTPILTNQKITFSKELTSSYLPIIDSLDYSKGVKLLATIMAYKEGFYAGTRSFKNNNPGNIGNTDSGANQSYKTLKDGIFAQINYITKVGSGTHSAHKFGNRTIKPFYSDEIAKNQKTYGIEPYLAGYEFNYQGQLGGFVKIYSTGARAGNSYLSMIISYFKSKGIVITEHTTIADICKIK